MHYEFIDEFPRSVVTDRRSAIDANSRARTAQAEAEQKSSESPTQAWIFHFLTVATSLAGASSGGISTLPKHVKMSDLIDNHRVEYRTAWEGQELTQRRLVHFRGFHRLRNIRRLRSDSFAPARHRDFHLAKKMSNISDNNHRHVGHETTREGL